MGKDFFKNTVAAVVGAGLIAGGASIAFADTWGDDDAFVDGATAIVNQVLTVDQFDAGLGTLTGVEVTVSGVYWTDIASITNTSAAGNMTSGLEVRGDYNAVFSSADGVTGLGDLAIDDNTMWGIFELALDPALVTIAAGDTYDFIANGHWNSFDNSMTINVAAGDIASFIGNGSFEYTYDSQGGWGTSGDSSNAAAQVGTSADGALSVVYTYTPDAPSDVPEPATMLLFGTGLLGLCYSASKKKK